MSANSVFEEIILEVKDRKISITFHWYYNTIKLLNHSYITLKRLKKEISNLSYRCH